MDDDFNIDNEHDPEILESIGTVNTTDIFGEVERFAQVYGRVNDVLLRALTALNSAKSALDTIEAELDLTIRKTAEITGEKTTEKKIESAVRASSRWREAKQAADAAETTVERSKLALKTLDKKDRMLELLARAQMREFGVLHRTQ